MSKQPPPQEVHWPEGAVFATAREIANRQGAVTFARRAVASLAEIARNRT